MQRCFFQFFCAIKRYLCIVQFGLFGGNIRPGLAYLFRSGTGFESDYNARVVSLTMHLLIDRATDLVRHHAFPLLIPAPG